jgi:hypothetical protein
MRISNPFAKKPRQLFVEGEIRVGVSSDFDEKELLQKFQMAGALHPWIDDEFGRTAMKVKVDTRIPRGDEYSTNPGSMFYDPEGVIVRISHDPLRESQVRAYKNFIICLTRELSHLLVPGKQVESYASIVITENLPV